MPGFSFDRFADDVEPKFFLLSRVFPCFDLPETPSVSWFSLAMVDLNETGCPGLGSTDVLTECVKLLFAVDFRTGCGVVELFPGVCLGFFADGTVTVLGGAICDEAPPSFLGDLLGARLGLAVIEEPLVAFMSNTVDSLIGNGLGDLIPA